LKEPGNDKLQWNFGGTYISRKLLLNEFSTYVYNFNDYHEPLYQLSKIIITWGRRWGSLV